MTFQRTSLNEPDLNFFFFFVKNVVLVEGEGYLSEDVHQEQEKQIQYPLFNKKLSDKKEVGTSLTSVVFCPIIKSKQNLQ